MKFLKFKGGKKAASGKKSAMPQKSMKTIVPGIEEFENDFPRCADVIAHVERVGQWGQGSAGSRVDPKVRVTDVQFIHQDTDIHLALKANYFASAREYMKKYSGCQIDDLEPIRVARYEVGGHYAVHTDARGGNRELSSVLYLNDDYEGGELYFPQFDVVYKPQAGSLLLFPSNFPYEHESRPITSGRKYCVLAWYRPLNL